MVSSGHNQASTFSSSASPEPGARSFAVLAPWLRPDRCSSGLLGPATALGVTETLVDEAEQLPCRRHPGGHRPPGRSSMRLNAGTIGRRGALQRKDDLHKP